MQYVVQFWSDGWRTDRAFGTVDEALCYAQNRSLEYRIGPATGLPNVLTPYHDWLDLNLESTRRYYQLSDQEFERIESLTEEAPLAKALVTFWRARADQACVAMILARSIL